MSCYCELVIKSFKCLLSISVCIHFEQVLFGRSNYNTDLGDYISIFSMIIFYTKLPVFAYFIYYQTFFFFKAQHYVQSN